jgi:hypothetical protein
MAGESAREVARQAREKAERLNRRAELFEQGAEGEATTARALEALPPGWKVMHDMRWPGRRLANVDHVLIGPSGIFVIDTKNWTGRVTATNGVLRQNGYSREKAVAGAADAALAVAEVAGPYAGHVHAVICFSGRDDVSAWCRDVAVCCTANLVPMLTNWPLRLTSEQVEDASLRLDDLMRRASARPVTRTTTRPARLAMQQAMRSRSPASRSRNRGRGRSSGSSFGRLLVGVVLVITFLAVGPQLAGALGGAISGKLTEDLDTSVCESQTAASEVQEKRRKDERKQESPSSKRQKETADCDP